MVNYVVGIRYVFCFEGGIRVNDVLDFNFFGVIDFEDVIEG